jgi:hypothetical protein
MELLMELNEKMSDITGADYVEILIRNDSKVIWININGICVFRVCEIKNLILNDERIK